MPGVPFAHRNSTKFNIFASQSTSYFKIKTGVLCCLGVSDFDIEWDSLLKF